MVQVQRCTHNKCKIRLFKSNIVFHTRYRNNTITPVGGGGGGYLTLYSGA